jgi:hypothetical protein
VTKKSGTHTVLESIDTTTRTAIISLDEKLKTLLLEINQKLSQLDGCEDHESQQQKKQLLTLTEEIQQALQSMDNVVNIAVSEDISQNEFLQQHSDELEKFREMILSNTKQLGGIKKK